jgi:NhaP-type Na+/H+ or K+/H+ antiporter
VRGLPESSLDGWRIAGLSILLLAVLTAARFASVALAKVLFDHGPARLRARTWNWRTVTAVSSAGVRGVVTLAAAFLLPEETPERELLQFLAFVMVAGTLVGGLALPAIIRRLRLGHTADDQERSDRDRLLDEARAAGLAARDRALADGDDGPGDEALPETTAERLTHDRVRRRMIDAERTAVLDARREGRYPEIAVRAVLGMIDAEDVALGRREADDAR